MNIKELSKLIKGIVDPNNLKDDSHNDLQVENTCKVTKIALAVDACLATIEGAKKAGAQVLLVHHGLYWGQQLPITGEKYNHYERVKALLSNNIGLIASHLPLDMHAELGNNVLIAKKLGLGKIEPFGACHDFKVGYKGEFDKAATIEEIVKRLGATMAACRYLPFGKKEIKTIGVVSGGGIDWIHDAISGGLDLFITGEGKHSTYHRALEGKINVLMAGHYFTETFGIKALGERVACETGIECVFIDVPTGF